MPAGFQTFDANGNLIIDLTTRSVKFIGELRGVNGAGSIIVPAFAEGTPFYFILPQGTTAPYVNGAYCWVTNGTTLNWSFPKIEVPPNWQSRYTIVPSDIFYGIF